MLPRKDRITTRNGRKAIYYAGIGGKKKRSESFIECVRRESREEILTEIDLRTSDSTWHFDSKERIHRVELDNKIRPIMLYEKPEPTAPELQGTRNDPVPQTYYGVVYLARTIAPPRPGAELGGLIYLSKEQVVRSLTEESSLRDVEMRGGRVVEIESLPRDAIVYPIGAPYYFAKLTRYALRHRIELL